MHWVVFLSALLVSITGTIQHWFLLSFPFRDKEIVVQIYEVNCLRLDRKQAIDLKFEARQFGSGFWLPLHKALFAFPFYYICII